MPDYTPEQQNLINGLDELLTIMLSREDILNGPIFKRMPFPKSDYIKQVVSDVINKGVKVTDIERNSISGQNIALYDFLEGYHILSAHACGCLLISFLNDLAKHREITLFEQNGSEQQNLTKEQFNPDPKINGICYKLITLLRKISSNRTSDYTAESLALTFSLLIFPKENNYDIQRRREPQLKQLINPSYHAQSSHRKMKQHFGESISTPTQDDHEREEDGLTAAEAPARSFGMKHLSKFLLMPLIALFAAALTVTLLIAFPPGGVALTIGILIAAGVGAGVAGVGTGFGFGAVIDHVREEQYNEQPMKHQNATTPLFDDRSLPVVDDSGHNFDSTPSPDEAPDQPTPSKNGL